MDIVFYIDFLKEDEHDNIVPESVKGFIVKNVDISEQALRDLVRPEMRFLQEKHFATHDWSTDLCPEVLGVGYTVFELNEAHIDALMNDWNQFFLRSFPESLVSKVVEVEGVGFDLDLGSDFEIYQAVLRKIME